MRIDSSKLNGPCECGEEHRMATRAAIVESGATGNLDAILGEFGISGKRVAVYDENTYDAANLVRPKADGEVILNPEGLHANEIATAKLLEELKGKTFDYLLAVGSGTIHDTTRYCANQLGVPFISVPTAASVDGFCSTVCAMTWHGRKNTMPGVAPLLVIADTAVIKEAPARLALSGIGDIVGKYTALADWKITSLLNGEHLCKRIYDMTMDAVRETYACSRKIPSRDEKAIASLTYALILSGLAMQLMGNSRPASGAEHHISHTIEMEPAAIGLHSDGLHGEKVGVGTIMISEKYHKLAGIRDISGHVRPYQFYTIPELRDFWGEALLPGILHENTIDPVTGAEDNPAMAAITPERLIEKWPEICAVIEEIPTPEKLKELYTEVGMKKTLEDVDIPSSYAEDLLYFSPSVRKRPTFNRISRMIAE